MLVWHGDRPQRENCRHREVLGPAPYSVGIIARPVKKNPLDKINLDRRRREEALLNEIQRLNKENRYREHTRWIGYTNKRFEKNYIHDRVNEAMNNESVHLDGKRCKLREFLLKEEDYHVKEMERLHDTPEERYQKMKARAEMLKNNREAERLKIVEEKRELQWLQRAEELRPILSKLGTHEVFRDRQRQIEMKKQMAKRLEEEDAMYADLWAKDRMAKALREEREEQFRVQRAQEHVKGLNVQVAEKEAVKELAAKAKQEELLLVNGENKIIQLEKDREWLAKKRQQQRTRVDLQNMMKYNLKQKIIQRQEELALDQKILEQVLQETKNEVAERKERRAQLTQETRQYLQYLREQAEMEAEREREIDLMHDAEVKEMWDKRAAEYKREKETRDRLMQEVLAVRKMQLQEKLEEAAKEREELARDRAEMCQMIEEHLKDKDNEERAIYLKNYRHAADLRGDRKSVV